jgi:serine/threonine protein kinase
MLRQAGFAAVEVHGLFPGYRHQKAAYPANGRVARQKVLNIVDPPASTLGAVAAQFSTATKISLLDFGDGRPKRITRVVKVGNDPARLVREYRFLETAEKLLAAETPALRLRWPRPLGNERPFFHFEYVEGPTLAQLLVPRRYRPLLVRDLVTQLVNGYLHLTERMTARWPVDADAVSCLDSLDGVDLGGELTRRLAQACERARKNNWQTQVMHGDLTLNNVIVTANGQLVLIDWENYSTNGLAVIDLMRLLFDAWTERKLYASWLDDDFLGHVRAAVRSGLARLQRGPADHADLALLFLAHQAQFDRTRDCAIDEMLDAYHQHALDLSV